MQISTAEYSLNRIYDEISSSVSRLSANREKSTSFSYEEQAERPSEKASVDFSFLHIGCLSPSSAFTLQKFISQPPALQSEQQKANKQEVERDNSDKKLNNEVQQIEKDDFLDELQSFLPQYSAQHISRIYEGGATVTANDNWLQNFNTAQNAKYASEAYNFVFNINNEPKIVIDFMHPNNRSFDFRI